MKGKQELKKKKSSQMNIPYGLLGLSKIRTGFRFSLLLFPFPFLLFYLFSSQRKKWGQYSHPKVRKYWYTDEKSAKALN